PRLEPRRGTAAPRGAPWRRRGLTPAAYGCAGLNENATSTGPATGQVQPSAEAGTTSAAATARTSRRIGRDLRCQVCKRSDRSKAGSQLSNLITASPQTAGCGRRPSALPPSTLHDDATLRARGALLLPSPPRPCPAQPRRLRRRA